MKHPLQSLVCAIFPCLLTACANGEALSDSPPVETFDTSVKIDVLRECIVVPHPSSYTVTPFRAGWRVAMAGGDFVAFEVDLFPIPNGTHVEIRKAKTLFQVAYNDEVAPCLDKAPKLH